MHRTNSNALSVLQFTALQGVVCKGELEVELNEFPHLLPKALFEHYAPTPFWGEGKTELPFTLPSPEGI